MKIPKAMTICNLEVLVMPNGEVLCSGKTIGWVASLGKYLTPKEKRCDQWLGEEYVGVTFSTPRLNPKRLCTCGLAALLGATPAQTGEKT